MAEFALASFAAFFVTVNPIQSAVLFSALTESGGRAYQRRMAIKSATVATGVLLAFTLLGDDLLRVIGISLPGVRVGGGILLMLVSIDIVFGRSIGPPAPRPGAGPAGAADVSVFPLATPIIAGPGAIAAAVVRASEVHGDTFGTALLLGVLGLVMALTLGALFGAATLQRWLGDTGMSVITRILGILLTALSAEMILTGLRTSGVFAGR